MKNIKKETKKQTNNTAASIAAYDEFTEKWANRNTNRKAFRIEYRIGQQRYEIDVPSHKKHDTSDKIYQRFISSITPENTPVAKDLHICEILGIIS